MCKCKCVSNVDICVPKSNFEGNFCVWQVYVFGTFGGLNVIVAHRVIYYVKYFNNFKFVDVRILVEKCNIYEAHIFSKSLVQTC